MTMEKEQFEDVSPIKNGDFPLTKRLKKGWVYTPKKGGGSSPKERRYSARLPSS